MPRINFDVSEHRQQELKTLQQDTASETMKDLFNDAVTIFSWMVEEVKKGNEIVSLDEKKGVYRVLVTPSLERVAQRVQQLEAASTKEQSLDEAKASPIETPRTR